VTPYALGMTAAITAASCLAAFAGNAAAETFCDAPPDPAFARLEAARVEDDWFKVYVVAPDVYAINEPRQEEQVTSFLIVGSKRALLFDSGLGIGRISEVVRKLTALPVIVLNSHTHFDHVGGNREFTDVRNLDEPFSQSNARGDVGEALREYAKDTLAEDRVCGSLPPAVASRTYSMPTWQASAAVKDGERLDLGGRTLEVVQTPGHTPDSMCLLDAANVGRIDAEAGDQVAGFGQQQPGFLQLRQSLADECQRGRNLFGERIPQRHIEPRAGENDRPGAADQAGANNGDLGHDKLPADPLRSAPPPRRVNAWHTILTGCGP